ncbi:hypothetical protein ASPU41_03660 [Arthrobacter sp. U41]|nr:hypothetical protein ASPU41_03660 [Arthrobacter sp. U41]
MSFCCSCQESGIAAVNRSISEATMPPKDDHAETFNESAGRRGHFWTWTQSETGTNGYSWAGSSLVALSVAGRHRFHAITDRTNGDCLGQTAA